MKCPKCHNIHKYRDGMTCRCGYGFVLNPKIYQMGDGAFLATVRKASGNSSQVFTERQLYTAFCQRHPRRATIIASNILAAISATVGAVALTVNLIVGIVFLVLATAFVACAILADALDYAHRQGVVHRDIKPDNVLVDDESGRPMLTDFGVAKSKAFGPTLTEIGVALGTPHYMSPEQASGELDIDGRSDLYSLGVMAYQMITGRLPFDADGFHEVLMQHMTTPPVPVAELQPDTPSDLLAVVGKCLQKEPVARWEDAQSLRRSLRMENSGRDDLPEELRALESTWSSTGFLITLGSAFAIHISRLWDVPWDGGVSWSLLPVGLASGMLFTWVHWQNELAPKGWSRKATLKVMFREPKWWMGWYPESLRRPSSMWHRLPFAFKVSRSVTFYGVFTAFGVMYALLFAMVAEPARWYGSSLADWLLGSGFAVVIAGLMPMGILHSRLLKRGLSHKETFAFFGSVMHKVDPSFWNKPHIAAILLPAELSPPTETIGDPKNVADLLEAITRAEREVDSPLKEIAREAVSAARRVVSAVEHYSNEIDTLLRDADPEEGARLEGKLKAPGETTEAKRTDHQRMRLLLEEQLALYRKLDDQLAHARDRRDHLTEMLRALWLQTANLRAQTAQQTIDMSDVTGNIRAVCEDIERHVSATEETVKVLTPSE